jgi:hypothetical protein
MSGVRSVTLLTLALAGFAACQKNSLQGDVPAGGIKPLPDGGPSNTGAAGTTGVFDGGFAGFGFGGSVGAGGASGGAPADYGASVCVLTSVQLPWAAVPGTLTPLEVIVSSDGSAIAVLNRQPTQLDVRTYRRDGTLLGGRQFAADVHVLAHTGDHFLLIAHGVSGNFGGTDVNPDLTGGGRTFMVESTVTERLRAVVAGPLGIVLLTTERFVNTTTKMAVPWTATLGPDAAAFASGHVYGATAQGNQILVAGGTGSSLGLMVLDSDGNLVRSGVDAQALDSLAGDTTTTVPFGGGLLMFDGNPPRLTQIGFDLSRTELGHNTQMGTFYRTAPRVAPIVLMGQPVGIWLTVYPGTDKSQGNTWHQLYACALDIAAPAACATALPIAQTGLGGYGIAQAPMSAAAMPDGRTFAVAHSDAADRTWLRVTDIACGAGDDLD